MEFVETRWHKYRDEKPRCGEIFVGRNGSTVYPGLFVVRKRLTAKFTDVVYMNDTSTVLGSPFDFFTHWLPVAEQHGGEGK